MFINIKALAVNKLSGVLVNSTDNIAITYFTGLTSVGYASNYTLFANTLNSLVTLLFNSLTGSVGNLNASSDKDTQYRFFKSLSLANFWIYGWAGIGMTFVSSDLVIWFYGGEYVMPMEIPLMLALNFYTIGMIHTCYVYKSTLGLFRYGQYILILTGFINLFLDVLLGRKFGITGIYLATLIARVCTNLWYEPYAVYRYGLQKPFRLYLWDYCVDTMILIIAGGVSWIGCSMCHFTAPVNALVKAIICTIVPNALFYTFFHNTDEGKFLLTRERNVVVRLIPGSKK